VSTLHALFIGIDDYFPDRLPDGSRYPSLSGAARDVARMALLLRDRAGLQPETTRMLLSRAREDGAPAEPPERRPTYANLVAAFHQLAVEARPGDRVYIHYSGHGARVPTEYPGLKGPSGLDEALVPCDIGEPGSRYLRDLELATLVRLLVDRDLLVTVVLDCCHAGGAMRGHRTGVAVPRRVPWVPLAPVPSAVGDPETLSEVWRHLQSEQRILRSLKLQSWLPVARYALFAACRPDELAFEYPFDHGEPQGALTYWLLDTLKGSAGGLSYGEIHQRLVARIRGFFASQTPMFLGESWRGFLSPERRSVQRANPLESPRVLRVDDDGRVLVDVGVPVGAQVGDRVLLKGWSSGGVAAELAIRQVGATESWAEVIRVSGPDAIEPGMQAEALRLRTAVRLIAPERGDLEAERALANLREALQKDPDGFVEVCEEDRAPDLCVMAERGLYEIQDPAGLPFRNLDPLPVDDSESVTEVIRRLDHLAKFRNILTVENPHPAAWLGIGLEVSEDGPDGGRVKVHSGALDLRVGEGLILRIVNRSSLRLDFTVLDLAPDYSVTQLLPQRGGFSLLSLDPDQAEVVRVQGFLPDGYNEGNDILKVFATVGAANFQWLALRPLRRPGPALHPRVEPPNPLEHLFAQLAAIRPAQRNGLVPSQFPEEEWITAQMEIRVRR
jgi:hypothetical protein